MGDDGYCRTCPTACFADHGQGLGLHSTGISTSAGSEECLAERGSSPRMETVGLRTCSRTSARARGRHWNDNDVTDLPKVDEKQKLGTRERRRTRTLESRDPEHRSLWDDYFLIASQSSGLVAFVFPCIFAANAIASPKPPIPSHVPAVNTAQRADRQGSPATGPDTRDDFRRRCMKTPTRDPEPRSTTQVTSGIVACVGAAFNSATRA